jgi:RNA polymerase primary sigma factor
MITMHEHDALEWRAVPSPEEREVFRGLHARDEHDASHVATWQDDVVRALLPEELPWAAPDDAAAPVEDDPASVPTRAAADPDTENLIAQYFGEVRRCALLSVAEEQALGRRIQRWQRRARWVLYTSPVALPTLHRLWQRVLQQDLALQEILEPLGATAPDQEARRRHFQQALRHLQALATRLGLLTSQDERPRPGGPEHCGSRHARFRLWRAWLTTCAALRLQPQVHATLRDALADARQRQPEDATLQAAARAWDRVQQELDHAKGQMMQANLRLVIHVAKHYAQRGVPLLDLIQEGNIGLMRAVDKFEPRRGVKFVTYAHWWIRQAITRALDEQHRTIRLPSHVLERQRTLRAAALRLREAHGHAPSVRELSTALEWTPQAVEELLTATKPIMPLEQPLTEDGGVRADLVEDVAAVRPEERVAETQLQRRLAEGLATLPAREAVILRLRYGLEASEPLNLREIGARLGVSHERIRQLEKQALATLRQSHCHTLLADFVGSV